MYRCPQDNCQGWIERDEESGIYFCDSCDNGYTQMVAEESEWEDDEVLQDADG